MTYRMTMTSSLGDKLKAASLSGSEQLGRLYSYQLKMWSEDNGIDLLTLLGSAITVAYEEGNFKRHINGIVAEASQTGFESFQGKSYTAYSVTLVPKAWLLLNKVDCRIYLKQSVPDIIKAVLAEIGFTDIKLDLSASYPVREYCVQYREDYFNFISRLMEQEGIYYFFRHSDGVHTMVLADSLGAHSATDGFATLPYLPQAGDSGALNEIALTEFSPMRSVQTIKYSLTDYDPLKPKASLLGVDSVNNADGNHSMSGLESFDYPGEHDSSDLGKHYAQVRIEAINAVQSQFSGATNAGGLLTGALFKVKGFPQDKLNQEYLVVGSTIHIENPMQGEEGEQLFCNFIAIPSKQPFRTMPVAVKPMVVGLQTAVVTGSDTAEDIAVDKYGRIQVTFHWNKPDKKNAQSSCPVRVASAWAGKSWGAVSIPRIGQEVVISFLEGDPDRPLVIGSVYNADNMPPYALPDNKTQSGIKSRSLLGGTDDFNELRFEDKKGSEDFFMHAQKDMHEEVENDHVVVIDHDETITIKNDQTTTVKHDQTLTVDNNQTETVKNNRSVTVQNDDTLKVSNNGSTSIGQKFKLDAGTEIELVCGASSIKLTSSGDVEIKGVNIKVTGDATIKMAGQASVDIGGGASVKVHSDAMMNVEGGAMTTVKGAMLQLTGDGMAKLAGGITMIG